ncbi:phosphodiester glycosidase family protein [Candidatus Shapirobacteria bacterium]|nr:phosphodiester glycosidase family protein [Candidatus Shapirobacteria bacterium]
MKPWHVGLILIMVALVSTQVFMAVLSEEEQQRLGNEQTLNSKLSELQKSLEEKNNSFEDFKKTDQVLLNQKLEADLKDIKVGYSGLIGTYEHLVDLRGEKKIYAKVDTMFALALNQLSENNYASAAATIKGLEDEIKKEQEKRALAAAAAVPVATGNSGATGTVKTESGEFRTNIISADLRSVKVVVDTASPSDCADNCPVLPLATFAQRSGAFAAINGPYFCPASYPACASKKNSFDTLMMNKNKTYFNSGNNVYSSVPAAIFSTNSRFVRQSSEWGRDTGIDSVIAGQPLLVFNGQSMFAGDGDPKKSGKGTRAFIGATDSTVYIGLVYNVTVAEMANVIVSKGIKNAINLDSGGSIAMWNNGRYVAGPGRDLPFGIMLVRR